MHTTSWIKNKSGVNTETAKEKWKKQEIEEEEERKKKREERMKERNKGKYESASSKMQIFQNVNCCQTHQWATWMGAKQTCIPGLTSPRF